MSEISKGARGSVFELTGVPPAGQVLPLGLQHVVAAIVGVVTPAILVSNTVGLDSADKTILIQVSLLITAIATLIQVFGNGRVGAGLPVIMGISFAYVPTLLAIGGQFDLPTILGAEIVGGCIAIVFGIFVKYLRVFFPPLVTGTVIFTIGLSLYPTAVKYMAGGAGSWRGTGGMATKLSAARIAMEAGCDMVITNGSRMEDLYGIAEGKDIGTRFVSGKTRN